MKIVQIVHEFMPEFVGGTELYCNAVARELAARGHECAVLTGTQESRPAPELVTVDQEGLLVTRLVGSLPWPDRWSPVYRPEVERLTLEYLTKLRPDVVHVQHWPRLTINLVAICKSLRIPTVVTLHDLWAICPRGNRLRWDGRFCTDPLSTAPCLSCVVRGEGEEDHQVAAELSHRQRLVTEELRHADRVLIPSEAQKAFLAQLGQAQGVRLQVIPHGSISSLPRSGSPDGGSGPLRVGYWGALVWWKGPHLLLEAFHHLPDPSRVEAHLFGHPMEPDYGSHLNALATGLRVIFHGPFSPADLPGAELHLAVFPSLCHESHSFVLDEAFQLGVPAIVSDRGAPASRIGSAGLTFKAGDARDLAAQIRRVLEEPGTLARLRRGTPAAPPVPFEMHVAQLEAVYRQVIAAAEVAQCTVEERW
jgi:glycosyltransferase involved in cell wall biosynthesis